MHLFVGLVVCEAHMHVCVWACMRVCICVCMGVHACVYACVLDMHACVYVCMAGHAGMMCVYGRA